jgi:hypothetical protein
MPCPLCSVRTDRSRCPWSGVRKTRDCLACIKPPAKRNCETCEGVGHSTCEQCKGLAKVHCGRCGGSGKMRTVIVGIFGGNGPTGKGGVKKHEDCKGKGIEACPICERGRMNCKECDKGKVSSCIHCDGTKRARCRGCNDQPYRSFDIYAEHLRKEKHHERSLDLLKTASERFLRVHAELNLALKKQVDRYLELEERANARASSNRKSTYYKERIKLRARERTVRKRLNAASERARAELAGNLITGNG